ncbi:hypothetical protein AQ611_06315 [Burkholderia singularis]|nr:hypothetical protein AQ611_06315 [Burkholderia sp. Bp7605]
MVFTYRLWCVTGGGESLASRQPGGGSDPGIEGAASRAVRRGGPSEAPRERFARGASMRIARRADRACRLRAAWRLKRGAGNYSELVGAVWRIALGRGCRLAASRVLINVTVPRRCEPQVRPHAKNRGGCPGTPPAHLMHVSYRRRGLTRFAFS